MTALEQALADAEHRKSRDIPTRFETARLILRAGTIADLDETAPVAAASAAELRPWMPWAYPAPSRDSMCGYFSSLEKKWADREVLDFQWIEKSSGQLIGKGGFHHIDWTLPKFEIGYWLRSASAGQGYCTEAVMGLIAFAKIEMDAKRLEICSDPRNAPSRAVAERCGFTLEGILRKNMRAPDGTLRDSCVYALVIE